MVIPGPARRFLLYVVWVLRRLTVLKEGLSLSNSLVILCLRSSRNGYIEPLYKNSVKLFSVFLDFYVCVYSGAIPAMMKKRNNRLKASPSSVFYPIHRRVQISLRNRAWSILVSH